MRIATRSLLLALVAVLWLAGCGNGGPVPAQPSSATRPATAQAGAGTTVAPTPARTSAPAASPPAAASQPAERELRSAALGVAFRYPAALEEGAGACRLAEAGGSILLSNNTAVAAVDAAQGDALAAHAERDLARFGAVSERSTPALLDSVAAITVQYCIEGSGRGGTITYALRGGLARRAVRAAARIAALPAVTARHTRRR